MQGTSKTWEEKREKLITLFRLPLLLGHSMNLSLDLHPHLFLHFSTQECCQTRQWGISGTGTVQSPFTKKQKNKTNLSFSIKTHRLPSLPLYLLHATLVCPSPQNSYGILHIFLHFSNLTLCWCELCRFLPITLACGLLESANEVLFPFVFTPYF